MAKINDLNDLLSGAGYDYVCERYANVIDNVQKTMVSNSLKTFGLIGAPEGKMFEARRVSCFGSSPYGAARSTDGTLLKSGSPCYIPLDNERELLEEIEARDVCLYSLEDVLNRKIIRHGLTLGRELERAFFDCAAREAAYFAPEPSCSYHEMLEELIATLESTENEFVNGVPRELISVGLPHSAFSAVKQYVGQENGLFARFNGAIVYSTGYLPKGIKALAMCDEAVAMPVTTNVYAPQRMGHSNAVSFGLFFGYGAKAVMPDLILKVE